MRLVARKSLGLDRFFFSAVAEAVQRAALALERVHHVHGGDGLAVSTSLNDPGEGISLGDRVGIGEFAYLGGGGGLTIGADCIVGQYFSCHPENHNYSDPETLIRLQGVSRKGIQIGNGCWIGSKVTILDGAKVGNHCVIAAGAVVAGVFPDHSVIGGVPARILKSRIQQSAA
jgi:acetyltransferase-like isoleucine patch superfamily enzyme